VVLHNVFPEEYKMILKRVEREEVSIVDVEEEALGFSHADVGGWLSSKWNFPPALNLPITYHHQVEAAGQENILQVSIVHLADILCRRAQIGSSGDNGIPSFQKVAKETLHIKPRIFSSHLLQLENPCCNVCFTILFLNIIIMPASQNSSNCAFRCGFLCFVTIPTAKSGLKSTK